MSRSRRPLLQVDFPALVRGDPVLAGIARLAADTHTRVFLVGGAVRDLLCGRQPRDRDFVLSGDNDACARLLSRLAGDHDTRVLVFERRGVRERRLPHADGDLDFVLTAPDTVTQELQRRDFTLNAIAVDVADGAVLDPTGGHDDLAAGILRQPGPGTFADDPLRCLRAVRLLATDADLDLDAGTAVDLRAHAKSLAGCAGERLGMEMDRIVGSGRFGASLATMRELGVLAALAPEAEAMAGVTQNDFHHLDCFAHTVTAVTLADDVPQLAPWLPGEIAGEDLLVLRYALFFHDLGKVETRSVGDDGRVHFYGHERVSARQAALMAARWKFSRRRTRRIISLVRLHLRPGALGPDATQRALRRLVHAASFDLELLVLMSLADVGATQGIDFEARRRHVADAGRQLLDLFSRESEALIEPRPFLDGREIMEILELPSGPRIGVVQRRLLRLQVEGVIGTRAEAETWLRRLAAQEDEVGDADPGEDSPAS